MITDALNEVKKMAALAAKDLRTRAPEMDGTAIIAEEEYIPDWNNEHDYTNVAVGSPVKYDGQVYTLLQPHNASYYPNTAPAALPALWRVKHTTDPAKAKPWVWPTSTSDMYLVGECMIWTDGLVYRATRDTNFSPEQYAQDWEEVT